MGTGELEVVESSAEICGTIVLRKTSMIQITVSDRMIAIEIVQTLLYVIANVIENEKGMIGLKGVHMAVITTTEKRIDELVEGKVSLFLCSQTKRENISCNSNYLKLDCLPVRFGDRDRRRPYDNREPEEPEWFSSGPTSQHDTIELRGFEDTPEDRAALSSSAAAKKQKPSPAQKKRNKKSNIEKEEKAAAVTAATAAAAAAASTAPQKDKNEVHTVGPKGNIFISTLNEYLI